MDAVSTKPRCKVGVSCVLLSAVDNLSVATAKAVWVAAVCSVLMTILLLLY